MDTSCINQVVVGCERVDVAVWGSLFVEASDADTGNWVWSCESSLAGCWDWTMDMVIHLSPQKLEWRRKLVTSGASTYLKLLSLILVTCKLVKLELGLEKPLLWYLWGFQTVTERQESDLYKRCKPDNCPEPIEGNLSLDPVEMGLTKLLSSTSSLWSRDDGNYGLIK